MSTSRQPIQDDLMSKQVLLCLVTVDRKSRDDLNLNGGTHEGVCYRGVD